MVYDLIYRKRSIDYIYSQFSHRSWTGTESDDSEEPKVQADSQATTVPASTPEIEAAKAEARKQHEEALKKIELQKSQAPLAQGPGVERKKKDNTNRPKSTKPVVKTAAKTLAKAKVAKKPVKAKIKSGESNPFDGPVDSDQTRLDFTNPQPPGSRAPSVTEKVPPAKPQVQHSQSMEDVTTMLNRPDTQELEDGTYDSNKEPASLEDLSNMLVKDLPEKKEETNEVEQKAMKPRTEDQKTRHNRRMRFYRSLTSWNLSQNESSIFKTIGGFNLLRCDMKWWSFETSFVILRVLSRDLGFWIPHDGSIRTVRPRRQLTSGSACDGRTSSWRHTGQSQVLRLGRTIFHGSIN